jgi:hypothetical protein
MYDAAVGRFWQVDPMAQKYVRLTPYNYVGNIPTILIDPDGREIDLSHIEDRKERRAVRQSLKEHKSSSTYKSLYKELKRSDNRYVVKTVNDNETAASFEANTVTRTQIESETGSITSLEFQNPATAGLFKSDEKGGVLTVNIGLTGNDPSAIADLLVEEVVHASQYENSVGKNKGATTEQGLPGTANTEFEAKTIVGQIQSESKRPLWTNSNDSGANAFGVQAFQTKSVNGYFDALKQWHSNPNLSSSYRGRRTTDAQPALLLRLIK